MAGSVEFSGICAPWSSSAWHWSWEDIYVSPNPTSMLPGHWVAATGTSTFSGQYFQECQQRTLSEQLQEDMREKTAEIRMNVNKLTVHFGAFFICASVRMMGQQWNFQSLCMFCCALGVYVIHSVLGRVKIRDHSQMTTVLSLLCQSLLLFSMWKETDLEHILCCEKFEAFGLIFTSLMTLDYKMILPMHVISALVFTYKHWQIVGFETVTPMMAYASLTWNSGFGVLIVFMLSTIKASIAAKRETHESSSLMLGFQKVLRGVCDGDVVLQRSSCNIAEDAACLERLLKCGRKLQHTNFLDLFLDAESRDAFQKFLDADVTEESLPTGLRVSLQGANGPVSMDLFHTKIPRDGGSDYSLLAMKEDADQSSRSIPPDAPETRENPAVPQTERGPGARSARSASSVSHVVEGYDELVQFSLLVNNSTDTRIPGTPTRFWVCFSSFDDSQIRRPRLQDLDDICEETEEICGDLAVIFAS
eukprot:Skav212001  [mRNA]  locus=scaffold304:113606:117411:+ [translate_table: standard]